jgi:hypothetical protein
LHKKNVVWRNASVGKTSFQKKNATLAQNKMGFAEITTEKMPDRPNNCHAWGALERLVVPEDDQACLTLYAEAVDAATAERLLDRWQKVVESAS